jgi:hypothetical protein
MFSLRNILVTLAVLSAVPISLAAPSAESTGVAALNEDVPTGDTIAFSVDDDLDAEDDGTNILDTRAILSILSARDEILDDDDELDTDDVLAVLEGRASCHTTSKPRRDCAHATCPDSECKMNRTGNRCVWTQPKRTRPSGCDACKCAKW